MCRDQAQWAANQALTAAWLRGDWDDKIRYFISPYNIYPIKNSLANMTRSGQANEDWEVMEDEKDEEMPEVDGFVMV